MGSSDAASSMVVGKITGSYGIKGWVKIHAYTEQRESFVQLGQWSVVRGRSAAASSTGNSSKTSSKTIESIQFDDFKLHGKGLIAHIAGVDDRDAAEAFKGLEVVAADEALPALEEGEFYWHQLQGLQVWCTEGDRRELLGVVDHLLETGANDVLVIRPCAGSYEGSAEESVNGGGKGKRKERLVPYLPGSTVTDVDLGLGTIEIDWFLDEE